MVCVGVSLSVYVYVCMCVYVCLRFGMCMRMLIHLGNPEMIWQLAPYIEQQLRKEFFLPPDAEMRIYGHFKVIQYIYIDIYLSIFIYRATCLSIHL